METDFGLERYLRDAMVWGRLHGKGVLVGEGGLVGGYRLQGEVGQHCLVRLDNMRGLSCS